MKRILLISFLLVSTLASQAWAQGRTVTGTVTSKEDSYGMPGVTVMVKGTSKGTTTDMNGAYQLSVPEENGTLVFSFIGMATKEVAIGAKSVIDVAMTSDVKQLSEVVVTALGIEKDRDRMASSTSQVTGDKISKSGEATVINGISGKTSGVNVVRSSGDPGAGSYIQIRGQSTVTGNLQPLIIVDGMPISNSTLGNGTGSGGGVTQQSRMNDINPDDIASMEILKGASAAALWGSRAANGVIVITTKKGNSGKGKLNVDVKSSVSFDQLYMTHETQNIWGQGNGGVYQFAPSGGRSWGDKIADRPGGEDTYDTSGEHFIADDGTKYYPIANGDAANPHGGKNSRDTYNYQDQLFKTGYYLDNSVGLSGGTKDENFYLSFSNLSQEGIIKENSDYEKTTARFNGMKRFNDYVKAKANFGYSKVGSNRAQMGSNLSGLYLGGLRSSADFDNSDYEGTYVAADGTKKLDAHRAYRNPLGANDNSIYDNPLWMMNNVLDRTDVNRFMGSAELTVEPAQWMDVTARIGFDNYTDKRKTFFPQYASGENNGGSLTLQTIEESQINADIFTNMNFELSDKLAVNAVAGMNFNNRLFTNTGGFASMFILADNPPLDLNNAEPANQTPFNSFSQRRNAAMYATTTFSYDEMLFATLTGRAETSSTFGRAATSTFFYPAAELAWQFNKIMPENDILSFGKLRATYGVVGREPSPYNTATYYTGGGFGESWGPALDASAYGGGYVRSSVLGNANLKPERKTQIELGTDMRFFNDRVNLSATYFQDKTVDAILSVGVAPSTGYSSKTGNAAVIANKGIELEMGVDLVKKKNFSWRMDGNWTAYRNEVVSLDGTESIFLAGFTGTSSRAVEGEPLGVFWGGRWDRNDAGELILDEDGFPQASSTEGVIGNPNPDWKGGISNTVSFKGFSLYALVDATWGGQIWAGTQGVLNTFGRSMESANESTSDVDLVNANGDVIPAGTTFRGNIKDFGGGPVALDETWYTNLGGGFGPVAEQFIQDASNVRLREISLSYTLNTPGFRNATKLQSIDFSVSGRNLYIWSKEYTGNDPETNLTGSSNGRGLDYFNNPSTRSYLFTVRIKY